MQSISKLESIMISVEQQYMKMRVGCGIGSVEWHSGILFNALSKFQIENWSSVTAELLTLSLCLVIFALKTRLVGVYHVWVYFPDDLCTTKEFWNAKGTWSQDNHKCISFLEYSHTGSGIRIRDELSIHLFIFEKNWDNSICLMCRHVSHVHCSCQTTKAIVWSDMGENQTNRGSWAHL